MKRALALGVALLAAGALFPPSALAHGLVSRGDLPIPAWLFGWAAAAVLIVSFVALAALWKRPQLEDSPRRPLGTTFSAVVTGPITEAACGLIGVALLGIAIWAGFAGVQSPADNITPTFVYVIFWVALVPVSALFGNVFSAFNPWRAIGRAVSWASSRAIGDQAGGAASVSQLARPLAGCRRSRRLRLARARLGQRRLCEDARGGGPRLLRP